MLQKFFNWDQLGVKLTVDSKMLFLQQSCSINLQTVELVSPGTAKYTLHSSRRFKLTKTNQQLTNTRH